MTTSGHHRNYTTLTDVTWDLSESERAQDKCILLPLYAQITELEQEAVALALEESLLESVPRAA